MIQDILFVPEIVAFYVIQVIGDLFDQALVVKLLLPLINPG